MKYIKKPVSIEAVQLTGSNIKECLEFIGQRVELNSRQAHDAFDTYCDIVLKDGMTIKTLEDGADGRAKHVATIGDYIIKGIQGEFYPCKPDIFKQTYHTEAEYAEL